MRQYVKKPVVIEAVQYNGANFNEIEKFCMPSSYQNATSCAELRKASDEHEALYILTLEGEHIASVGDYIIRGIKGEFYPCKPDIFEASYDYCEPTMCVEPSYPVTFCFGTAIDTLKMGAKVARKGWNGKGIFIQLKSPSPNSDMTNPYIFIDTTGLISDNEFAPRSLVPWLASQTDMLADDWMIVEEK